MLLVLSSDAHFCLSVVGRSVTAPKHAFICVADGVGSWRSYGVDPKLYAQKFVENAQRCVELDASNRGGLDTYPRGELAGLFDKDPVHPLEVLVDAFQMTQFDQVTGSCCVCVAHIDPQRMQLSYSNLGDCGLMVVRRIDSDGAGSLRERQRPRDERTNDLRIAYLSQQQLKSFNRPYQLGYSTFPEHQSTAGGASIFQEPTEADSGSYHIHCWYRFSVTESLVSLCAERSVYPGDGGRYCPCGIGRIIRQCGTWYVTLIIAIMRTL